MTAIEQLTAWAATPESDIFVGVGCGKKPYVTARVKAGTAGGFRKMADANVARVEAIKGFTCVIIDGHMPEAPQLQYRIILSPVEPFSQ